MEELRDKSLVMIVGPTAVGKSTLMNEVVRLDTEFKRVKSFTTRPPRDNDEPDQYFYVSKEEFNQLKTDGKTVTDTIFPTTGQVYGTLAESYWARYNLLDTLANSVDLYRHLPFERTVTISLVASPHQWRDWLLERYPEPSPERTKRLEQARQSLDWSLAQTEDHYWILNERDEQTATAKQIVAIARGEAEGLAGLAHDAGNMLGVVNDLLMTGEKAT